MKKILEASGWIIILMIAISCQAQPKPIAVIVNKDTTFISPVDSALYFKVSAKYDSIKHKNDSLETALVRANLKVIRVKYYLNLVNKNPKKYGPFLKGWLNGLFENQ
jgi:hypothetical protein